LGVEELKEGHGIFAAGLHGVLELCHGTMEPPFRWYNLWQIHKVSRFALFKQGSYLGCGEFIWSRSESRHRPVSIEAWQTADDILSALLKAIYDETLQGSPDKTLVVGFDSHANLIEVILHVVSDDSIVVFHAMACRKVYLDRIAR
jgi:hypothetical protein